MTRHGPDHQAPSHHPRYHGASEDSGPAAASHQRTARQRRMRVLVIAVVIALLLAIVIMHATGAMPRGTGI